MQSSLETERKYLIRKPDFEVLSKMESYTVSDIEQIYVKTIRIRYINSIMNITYLRNAMKMGNT